MEGIKEVSGFATSFWKNIYCIILYFIILLMLQIITGHLCCCGPDRLTTALTGVMKGSCAGREFSVITTARHAPHIQGEAVTPDTDLCLISSSKSLAATWDTLSFSRLFAFSVVHILVTGIICCVCVKESGVRSSLALAWKSFIGVRFACFVHSALEKCNLTWCRRAWGLEVRILGFMLLEERNKYPFEHITQCCPPFKWGS